MQNLSSPASNPRGLNLKPALVMGARRPRQWLEGLEALKTHVSWFFTGYLEGGSEFGQLFKAALLFTQRHRPQTADKHVFKVRKIALARNNEIGSTYCIVYAL